MCSLLCWTLYSTEKESKAVFKENFSFGGQNSIYRTNYHSSYILGAIINVQTKYGIVW